MRNAKFVKNTLMHRRHSLQLGQFKFRPGKVLTMGCGVSSAGGGADTESRLGREHSEDDGDEDSHLDFR